jgi:outer membrane protein assembly factor BamB
VYAVGHFRETADFGSASNPMLLTSPTPDVANTYFVKLDATSGDSVWVHQIGGPDSAAGVRVAADGSGNLYVAGIFSGTVSVGASGSTLTSAGGHDGYISRYRKRHG